MNRALHWAWACVLGKTNMLAIDRGKNAEKAFNRMRDLPVIGRIIALERWDVVSALRDGPKEIWARPKHRAGKEAPVVGKALAGTK